jgi:hypothetical protein
VLTGFIVSKKADAAIANPFVKGPFHHGAEVPLQIEIRYCGSELYWVQ